MKQRQGRRTTRGTTGRTRRQLLAAAVGAAAVLATTAPAPTAAARDRNADAVAAAYLDLQQCSYYSEALADHFTTVLTPSGDGRYSTGTRVSPTPDTAATCGGGNGVHVPVPLLAGVKALDLSGGRYLNLHQCDYYYERNTDHFTTLVTPSGDGRYSTGTKVSDTPETQMACGYGNGNHVPHVALSGVKALDLRAGGYLNLHQCVYYAQSTTNHLTTLVPIADARFTTGTNVSNAADTRPVCGPGNGAHVLVPLLSAVKSFKLR
ncbi:hypothetical protein [Streptomyces sp. NPDC050504]|uniref:hypothetical protein n=1 Tax=Streptomyces sp. NPDC050504 TaxID=3365618 RepID=UPI0037ABFCB9